MGLNGGGSKAKTAAKVDGTSIPETEVDALLLHAKTEAQREGKPFPATGSDQYKSLARQALDLLVYHEELAQAGRSLGINVTEAEISTGAGETEGGGGSLVGTTNEILFRRDAVRGQLLYRRIFRRVTRGVTVGPEEVRAYYRSHATLYRQQGRSFTRARSSIAANLLETKRNAAMANWVEGMRRKFAAKVAYSPRFRAP